MSHMEEHCLHETRKALFMVVNSICQVDDTCGHASLQKDLKYLLGVGVGVGEDHMMAMLMPFLQQLMGIA